MAVELIIANKTSGKMWNVASCVPSASWTTNRTGSPGVFKFTLLKAGDVSFTEGDTVRFSIDGEMQFFGWVFTKIKNRFNEIEVTCYDRLRYLKANASYAFYSQTAADIIKQIAEDFELTTGALEDTGYAIPSLIEQDQSCIDIIETALQKTLLNTGKIFVFYDDGDGLALKEAGNMKSDYMIGDRSYLTDYSYKTDIDEQTYNRVKLARPNDQTGRADVFVAEDSSTIKKWGLLQLYQTVDGDVNDAQVKSQAEATLKAYNRRYRSLSVSSLGVPGLRAGMMLLMNVPGLGDINLNQYVLLDRVSHTWEKDQETEKNVHTMEFDAIIP